MTAYVEVAGGDVILAATVNDLIRYTMNKPVCKLVVQSVQSIPDNTSTALAYGAGSDEIDTHNMHDTVTNNTRITPTVPGIYWFDAEYFTAQMSNNAGMVMSFSFRKNGATTMIPGPRQTSPTHTLSAGTVTTYTWAAHSLGGGTFIECNGTTDYVEMMVLQDSNGAVNANASSQFSSVFQCELVRYTQ